MFKWNHAKYRNNQIVEIWICHFGISYWDIEVRNRSNRRSCTYAQTHTHEGGEMQPVLGPIQLAWQWVLRHYVFPTAKFDNWGVAITSYSKSGAARIMITDPVLQSWSFVIGMPWYPDTKLLRLLVEIRNCFFLWSESTHAHNHVEYSNCEFWYFTTLKQNGIFKFHWI